MGLLSMVTLYVRHFLSQRLNKVDCCSYCGPCALRSFRVLGFEGIELCCTKTNIDLRVATVPDNTEIHYWTCFISVTVSEFQTPDIHCEQQRKASE